MSLLIFKKITDQKSKIGVPISSPLFKRYYRSPGKVLRYITTIPEILFAKLPMVRLLLAQCFILKFPPILFGKDYCLFYQPYNRIRANQEQIKHLPNIFFLFKVNSYFSC